MNTEASGTLPQVHTADDHVVKIFVMCMKPGRILVNTPSAQGATGNVYNDFLPTLPLGCGTYGGNSVLIM